MRQTAAFRFPCYHPRTRNAECSSRPSVLTIVMTAASVVSTRIFHVIRLRAGFTAACFVAVFLVVLSRMLLVLVAATGPTEASSVFVLVGHAPSPSVETR